METSQIRINSDLTIIAISSGDGLAQMFKRVGANIILNCSGNVLPTKDNLINIISKDTTRDIIILPNNPNLISMVERICENFKDKNVCMIPTKTMAEGISALSLEFNPADKLDGIVEKMLEKIKGTRTGVVSIADKDTLIDNVAINKGDFLGWVDGKIAIVKQDAFDCACEIIKISVSNKTKFINIYYGTTVKKEEAQTIVDFISAVFIDCQVRWFKGNQSNCLYILSVE